jgi:UDP-glucose 4-epimerase
VEKTVEKPSDPYGTSKMWPENIILTKAGEADRWAKVDRFSRIFWPIH